MIWWCDKVIWQGDMAKLYGTWQSDMTKHVQALVYLLLVSASLIVLKYSALAGWGRSRSSLIRFRDITDIIQGVFFNCSSQFSVPKRKTLGSQSENLFHEILDVQMILVGWTTFFFLALDRTVKKAPCMYLFMLVDHDLDSKNCRAIQHEQAAVKLKSPYA